MSEALPRVVIVGGRFGAPAAAKAGKHDATSEGDFYMKGGIDEVKPS